MRPGLTLLFSFPLLAGALNAVQAAPGDFRRAIDKARAALEEVDLETAQNWISVALNTFDTPPERAEALDLLGWLQGIETRYGSAFRQYFSAARIGGKAAVSSIEHPQTASRQVAECAVQLADEGRTLVEATARLRDENGIEAAVDLDKGLAALLFSDTFVCPKPEGPKARPPMAIGPPAAPPEASPSEASVTGASPASNPLRASETSRPLFNLSPEPPLATWVLGGVALAALGTGGLLTGLAVDEANQLRAENFSEDIGSVDTLSTAYGIAYGAAGAAAVGALLFWFLDGGAENPTAEVDLAPGSFSVRF